MIFNWVIPITIILFTSFTKWWHTLPVDAPDTIYHGFPFPYAGSAWHTSGAYQFFIIEYIADLFVYFILVAFLTFLINRYVIEINLHRLFSIVLWSFSVVLLGMQVLIISNNDNVFYLIRSYDMKVLSTGYQFLWNNIH